MSVESGKVAPAKWRVMGPKGVVRARGELIYFHEMKEGREYHLSPRVINDLGGIMVGVNPPVPAIEGDEHMEYYG